jgi:hypothetical protein
LDPAELEVLLQQELGDQQAPETLNWHQSLHPPLLQELVPGSLQQPPPVQLEVQLEVQLQ